MLNSPVFLIAYFPTFTVVCAVASPLCPAPPCLALFCLALFCLAPLFPLFIIVSTKPSLSPAFPFSRGPERRNCRAQKGEEECSQKEFRGNVLSNCLPRHVVAILSAPADL